MHKAKTTKKVKGVVIPLKYVEAVDRGVKLLDMLLGRKEWLRRFDSDRFNIRSSSSCVAGQIFSDDFFSRSDGPTDGYTRFVQFLDGIKKSGRAKHFGFHSGGSAKGWQYLQDLWYAKISNLKRAQKRG
jgi:hypothetical protein